jgi:hypothetical protein
LAIQENKESGEFSLHFSDKSDPNALFYFDLANVKDVLNF